MKPSNETTMKVAGAMPGPDSPESTPRIKINLNQNDGNTWVSAEKNSGSVQTEHKRQSNTTNDVTPTSESLGPQSGG